MMRSIRYIFMFCIVLFSAVTASAQIAMPDYVYIGSTKHYSVDPNPVPGSTYTWWIDGIQQVGETSNSIDITWTTTTPNPHILSVQERSADGCDGPVRSGEVYVYQVTPPDNLSECVEDLHTATYDIATDQLITDNPDYYTFMPGDTRLDLSPYNLTDIFPPSCPVQIRWQIDFAPTPDPAEPHNMVTKPPVSGTGQPSQITGNIQLPGDGINFNDIVHTITYSIVDCHGNVSYTISRTITIKPRPNIMKVN